MADFRGVGASGGDVRDSVLEAIGDSDVTSVLDAVGCRRVVLLGTGLGGPTAIRYAAHHPERVQALVLVDTSAYFVREDDCPWGLPRESLDRWAGAMAEMWGTGAAADVIAPSKSGDETFRAWWARAERLGSAVNQVAAILRVLLLQDVRALLPTLAVPTLVLHRVGNISVPVGAGCYLVDQIPGADYIELPGDDAMFFVGDTDALLDGIEEFLTGRRQAPEGDVVSATILFTDIVASTEQSARMGHRKWTTLTERPPPPRASICRRESGRLVNMSVTGSRYCESIASSSDPLQAPSLRIPALPAPPTVDRTGRSSRSDRMRLMKGSRMMDLPCELRSNLLRQKMCVWTPSPHHNRWQ